jgi:hypothetical protein
MQFVSFLFSSFCFFLRSPASTQTDWHEGGLLTQRSCIDNPWSSWSGISRRGHTHTHARTHARTHAQMCTSLTLEEGSKIRERTLIAKERQRNDDKKRKVGLDIWIKVRLHL